MVGGCDRGCLLWTGAILNNCIRMFYGTFLQQWDRRFVHQETGFLSGPVAFLSELGEHVEHSSTQARTT